MLNISELSLPELEQVFTEHGLPRFRAKQVYLQIHKRANLDFALMTDLSLALRGELAYWAKITAPKILDRRVSANGETVKLLLEYEDGAKIETVLMLYDGDDTRKRRTVCVSTQVGCAMACTFCATAIGGFERNLSAAEIEAQVLVSAAWLNENQLGEVTNVVYMGMGEPLLNYEETLRSIRLLNDENGQNIGVRRMTVSTCGIVPAIYRLADEGLGISLALSLHAPNDKLRLALMPVNKKYPLKEVLAACVAYGDKTGRRVTYEYALFSGINDDDKCGKELGKLLAGKLSHVNIIPANHVAETGFLPSDRETIKEFCKIVQDCGVEATIRSSRGGDIDGACGQLRRKNLSSGGAL